MSRDLAQGAKVAVVGGGLAGLAAAVVLAERGLQVELYEARRRLGGRAASWRDPATGELVDFCQHVGMACCTNWLDFCRRAGLLELLRRDREIFFFGPDGRRFALRGARWLPAPMHLLPSLMRLGYLTVRERLSVVAAMLRLMRARDRDSETFGDWLRRQGQSAAAVERFWAPVVVSALGESLDRASLGYARKVFVDGFLAHPNAYEIDVPTVPLGEFYGERLAQRLYRLGVAVRIETPIASIARGDDGRFELAASGTAPRTADAVVMAVTWRRAAELLAPFHAQWPAIRRWSELHAAPISGVHLWFDRPITELPHAVLVGTLAQWLFTPEARSSERAARNSEPDAGESPPAARSVFRVPRSEFYYQVVVSASYDLGRMDKQVAVERIVGELKAVFPEAAAARLLRWKIVTEPEAVFSARPGIDELRPSQTTPIPGLYVAGDWTATGWPATMEGAVRSGYLAAEAVLASAGRPERVVVPDLPRSRTVRMLVGDK